MRIALFLGGSEHVGGGFQHAFVTVDALTSGRVRRHEVVVVSTSNDSAASLKARGISTLTFKRRAAYLALDRLSATYVGGAAVRCLQRLGLRRAGRYLDSFLDNHNIDLVLFTEPSELSLCLSDHAFIITVWDTCHRDHVEFPEVSKARTFEKRERIYHLALPRAVAVVTNARAAAHRIASLYHMDPARIIELPLLPSVAVRRYAAGDGQQTIEEVRRKYRLPERYVFYPAQFWPHKNHVYVLEGLVELKHRHGIELDAVFCGTDKGNRATVERQVHQLSLGHRVHFLGFVPDDDIPPLYAGAVALVMPTYFGPTNIPPLEATALGCPVIYSDFPEFREQMGDAALYCSLSDPASLADHVATLIRNPGEACDRRSAGLKHAAQVASIDYVQRLTAAFDAFAYLRRRWAASE